MRVSPRRSSSLFPAPVSHLPDGYLDYQPRESGALLPDWAQFMPWPHEPPQLRWIYWESSGIFDPTQILLKTKWKREAVVYA